MGLEAKIPKTKIFFTHFLKTTYEPCPPTAKPLFRINRATPAISRGVPQVVPPIKGDVFFRNPLWEQLLTMNTGTPTDLELLQITGSLRGRAKSSRPRRQAKNARRRGLLHVENVFGRQRRHRALQPAAIERVIWIRSLLCKTNPISERPK